jgi:chromosome segregation ATPase
LRGQLPETIEDALIPAAYIESRQVQVLKAQRRLTDHSKQEQILKERDNFMSLVDTIRNQIGALNESRESPEESKDELTTKRNLLLQELNKVDQDIADVNDKLSQIPSAIKKLEEKKQEHARQAYQLHKSLQSIPGSADDDSREIQEANEICLRAMKSIQNALGLL